MNEQENHESTESRNDDYARQPPGATEVEALEAARVAFADAPTLRQELAAAKDRALRAQAELDNY
ncbi:MAG TPA: hypothetical protein PK867_31790, partial [Pirellulales bacterium]|nr:hypothetical protein [Pirellulales bacterium]